MIPSFEHRHARGGRACPAFGGDSSSSSASSNTSYNTTTTNNTDSRMVLDNGSFGLSNHGGWMNYAPTDSRAYTSNDSRSYTSNDSRQYLNNDSRSYTSNDSRQYLNNDSRSYTNNTSDSRSYTSNSSDSRAYTSNFSSTDNSTHITTDQGAVTAGRDIALTGLNTNATNVDHLLQVADHLMTQQQAALDANTNLTRSLAGTAQTAYSDATAQASGNKNVMLAALAVVAVVGFAAAGKH